MTQIRPVRPADAPYLIEIWRTAVDATHHFLAPADRLEIERSVRDYLPAAPLTVAIDDQDRPIAFLHLEDGHVHALFVHVDHHGRGVGRALLRHALDRGGPISVDVNEQNKIAAAFYRRFGFEPAGRSETDEQGRPYPLLHLRHP